MGSDSGLSPVSCQAIILTNAGLSLIIPLGTSFGTKPISVAKIFASNFGNRLCIG